MVNKSIFGTTELLIYSERGENADYYGEKIIVVSVKLKEVISLPTADMSAVRGSSHYS